MNKIERFSFKIQKKYIYIYIYQNTGFMQGLNLADDWLKLIRFYSCYIIFLVCKTITQTLKTKIK